MLLLPVHVGEKPRLKALTAGAPHPHPGVGLQWHKLGLSGMHTMGNCRATRQESIRNGLVRIWDLAR